MRLSSATVALLPVAANAINVVISNDDGWAVSNIRQLYSSLKDAGYDALVSAPAENQSGRSSLDSDPDPVGDDGCQFDSCPPNSPPTGANDTNPELNYVNSYPVTSMKYGLDTLASQIFGGSAADIALAGPNVGSNLGVVVYFSGTVGAATAASKQGVPGIAFSGSSGDPTAWNEPVPAYSEVYAQLATKLTTAVTDAGKPYLPENVWLNVNLPASSDTACSSADDFKFVLSRIHLAVPFISDDDVETCGNGGRLPRESEVVDTPGCYVSVSVGSADDKGDAEKAKQQTVLDNLGDFLTCLPDS